MLDNTYMEINLLTIQIELFNTNFHQLHVGKTQANSPFMAAKNGQSLN